MAETKFGWKPTNNNEVIDIHINSGEFTISDQVGKIVVLPSSGDCGKIETYGYEFELEKFPPSNLEPMPNVPSIKRSRENSECEKDYLVTWFNNGSNMQYSSVVKNSDIFTVKGVDDGRFEAIRYKTRQCKFTTSSMSFRTATYKDCGYPKIKTKPFCNCSNEQEPKYKQGATYNGHKIYYVPSSSTIPDGAFSGVTDLVEVYFPFKTTERPVGNPYKCYATQTIGANAFRGCNNLSAVTFSSVETIGANAFSGCIKLKDIDWGNCCHASEMRTINSNAFDGCSSLEQLVFPYYLETIGESAFKNCTGLTSVTFRNPSTSADSNSFIGCTSLRFVYFAYNKPPEWSFSSAFGSVNSISVVIPIGAQTDVWETWCNKTVTTGVIDYGCDEN